MFLRLLRKDILLHYRNRQKGVVILLFCVSLLFSVSVALPLKTLAGGVAGPFYWMIVLFAAMLLVDAGMTYETEDDAVSQLKLSVGDLTTVFWSKTCALVLVLVFLQAPLLVLTLLFFNVALTPILGLAPLLALLITAGLSGLLVCFYPIQMLSRERTWLLPILAFPFTVPLMIAGSAMFEEIFAGRTDFASFLLLAIAFDGIFLPACMLVFPLLVEEW